MRRWSKTRAKVLARLSLVVCVLVLRTAFAQAAPAEMEDCLLEALKGATDDTTVGQLRKRCEERLQIQRTVVKGPVEEPLTAEAQMERSPWAITPHKPNYLLPIAYNDRLNSAPFGGFTRDAEELKEIEAKFQISFKFPLARGLFKDSTDLYFAYTNQSWWQLYASNISAPFRETNHEPEVFFRINGGWELWGLRNNFIDLGFVHQSNGRSIPLSRSWNRLFATFVFERGDFALGVKPWIIVGDTDDNPDIEDFLGHGEMRAVYLWRRHTFTGLLRNNLSTSDNKGAVELTWSYPLSGVLRWYGQYYYGYGESLLDYNWKVNRIGVGIAVSDYLQR